MFGLRPIGYTAPMQTVSSDLVRDPAVHAGFNVVSGILVRAADLTLGSQCGQEDLQRDRDAPADFKAWPCPSDDKSRWEMINGD